MDRAVWTALQPQRPMTLDELQVVTGCDAGEVLVYLNILTRHQYVSVLGIRRASSGEALPLFRLTKATGPEAPYGNAEDLFCDPNLDSGRKQKHGCANRWGRCPACRDGSGSRPNSSIGRSNATRSSRSRGNQVKRSRAPGRD